MAGREHVDQPRLAVDVLAAGDQVLEDLGVRRLAGQSLPAVRRDLGHRVLTACAA